MPSDVESYLEAKDTYIRAVATLRGLAYQAAEVAGARGEQIELLLPPAMRPAFGKRFVVPTVPTGDQLDLRNFPTADQIRSAALAAGAAWAELLARFDQLSAIEQKGISQPPEEARKAAVQGATQ